MHLDLTGGLAAARPPFAEPSDCGVATKPTLKTFKRDLGRAGIPFRDDNGRTVDLHAMKTTFVSWLGQHGVDPRAQTILSHSDG